MMVYDGGVMEYDGEMMEYDGGMMEYDGGIRLGSFSSRDLDTR